MRVVMALAGSLLAGIDQAAVIQFLVGGCAEVRRLARADDLGMRIQSARSQFGRGAIEIAHAKTVVASFA